MKQLERPTWLLFACWAIAAAISLSAPNADAQQALSKSEIVTITDADKEFFSTVDVIRAAFEKIAADSPAVRDADEAAKRLAKDPLNDQLKKAMIEARSKVLKEKSSQTGDVVQYQKQLDSAYESVKKQYDAQLAEIQASIQAQVFAEDSEAQFLTEALAELKALDQLLPKAENTQVSNDINQAIKLTAQQHEDIRRFKQQLQASELEMKLAQQSVNLQQRQLAMLGFARVKATEEYLNLKMAMASARADQAIFGAIARNDLVALKVISEQERLNLIISREPVKYRSPTSNGLFGDGLQFSDLPGQEGVKRPDEISNSELRERIQKALDDRKPNSELIESTENQSNPKNERKTK